VDSAFQLQNQKKIQKIAKINETPQMCFWAGTK